MCIFCKIIAREQSSDMVYESDQIIAFRDINPKSPVHILICPKKHISSIKDITKEDKDILGEMLLAAKVIAEDQKIDEGYKLLFNVGKSVGQVIDHLHLHLMGGWQS